MHILINKIKVLDGRGVVEANQPLQIEHYCATTYAWFTCIKYYLHQFLRKKFQISHKSFAQNQKILPQVTFVLYRFCITYIYSLHYNFTFVQSYVQKMY